MLEMQEVAYILANATSKSFVIIDEIGRGTSTYDGMSLAWAILKENHDRIKAKTLFSTHYHELCDEAEKLPGSANYSVSV
jgi:DNA mismatch repair protein MutS